LRCLSLAACLDKLAPFAVMEFGRKGVRERSGVS